jgi:hypothetical protein
MATHTLGSNHDLLLTHTAGAFTDAAYDEACETRDDGNAFRGLFFAMIFNVMLVLTGAAGWVLWTLLR